MKFLREPKFAYSLRGGALKSTSDSKSQIVSNVKISAHRCTPLHHVSSGLQGSGMLYLGHRRKATLNQSTFSRALNLKAAEGTTLQATQTAIKTQSSNRGRIVSDSEQRRADWAILKEMSQYLWPQVDSR